MKRLLVLGLCCCCAGLLFAEDEGADEKDRTFKQGDEIIVFLNEEEPDLAHKVTAKIVEILSNGKLKIHASKSLENSEEIHTYELKGIINSDDISSENTISGNQVANLHILKRIIKKEDEEDEEQEILVLPVGLPCTVHLVRDKHQHALSGRILQINDQWLILEKGQNLQWIPREVILYVSLKSK